MTILHTRARELIVFSNHNKLRGINAVLPVYLLGNPKT